MTIQPNIKVRTEVTLLATLELNEKMLKALEAITSYGDKAFFETFYARLGSSNAVKGNQADLIELFDMVRDQVRPALVAIKEARDNLGKVNGK